ncbi:hypothetical protein JHE03_11680 [Pluralibacter gergoviae]|uniref:nSTAND3 domain-containing NTPase n=1 Tax=Pluralibacter gergoviae TaxID=61647 RepID=UPI00190C3E3D|nr:hypothetical protein [Pluralibacter gergoviae]ELC3074270.1 hypothetical protein [Pluralibacter gergoviae]MBK4116956.1 hypothetical protein [Pluralibacter gergoviae]
MSAETELNGHRAHGPWSDLALHTIGWRAFQDLCSQVCEVVLGRPVEIFREANDGGQDAVFLIPSEATTPPIGTVQCKHTSDAGRALKVSDLTAELRNVEELVKAGQADTYIFMTNMSVDAPVAAAVRVKLRALGVRKVHIFGRQHIVRVIRSSARLRALVPQVYGLGDLTAIVDERLSEQSRALLDSWIPKLRTYVPTKAHRDAVNAISKHGVVLLLGNPSSGKSAIGAIVSTIASENADNTVLALTSPRDFESGWNPNDPGRFFWIDDAFGSNVLRDDYVQDWASAFSKLRAAIAHGNRFLLTSRKHIYEAARRRLGQRNLPQFADESAVVDVGELTLDEKTQILYNHVNFGTQTQSWRSSVKPHLEAVAAVPGFLPGIAERMGDPNFTKSLAPGKSALVQFMKEPREHLVDTVNALDDHLQAALILVYVHQAGFDPNDHDPIAAQAVAELTGFPLARIQDCFAELKGSFLKLSGSKWTFAHPTISDALTEILRQKPHMMAALIHGATIDTILSSFTCEDSSLIRDALVIPTSLADALVGRLGHTPNELHRNWMLFLFLAYRASDVVFSKVISASPELLRRSCWHTEPLGNDPRVATYARAHRLDLLPDDLRSEAVDELETAALKNFDASFFGEEDKLALIPPLRLVGLGVGLRTAVLPSLEERIDEIMDDADLDEEPESHFENLLGMLNHVETIGVDDDAASLIDDAREQVKWSIKAIEERKRERDEEADTTDWTHIVTQKKDEVSTASPPPPPTTNKRSVFDDVDK